MNTTNPQAYLGGLVSRSTPFASSRSVQVCIHGHFYQPPRENPFTGQVPREMGAEPYANFNEKINAECYRPNAEAGNFERISFNLGPTLASWIEQHDPATHQRIVESDRLNYERYGYGNALAQNYNHVIMPLARPAEAHLQIEWGIMDFERRFGHRPEGMWLAETGASTWVLDLLAQAGIKFVILAPWQADTTSIETINPKERMIWQSRLRQQIVDGWKAEFMANVAPEAANSPQTQAAMLDYVASRLGQLPTRLPEPYDVSEPYLVELNEGRTIAVFFYNGRLSGDISFSQEATADADRYAAEWLLAEVNREKQAARQPQLIMIATDGELYGHHQAYRDHFLKHLTLFALPGHDIELTFPSRYLRENPPRRRICIHDDSSWSCHHGVERWSRGCGCTPGNTNWKPVLRQALDLLAIEVDALYDRHGAALFHDPQAALREFLFVWQKLEPVESFMGRHLRPESQSRRSLALRLLRAQLYKHQMYTSCAWFFEDIDRIEPKNALASAAIIFRLLGHRLPPDLRRRFKKTLGSTTSQHTGLSGAQLYRRHLRQATQLRLLRPKKRPQPRPVSLPAQPEYEPLLKQAV